MRRRGVRRIAETAQAVGVGRASARARSGKRRRPCRCRGNRVYGRKSSRLDHVQERLPQHLGPSPSATHAVLTEPKPCLPPNGPAPAPSLHLSLTSRLRVPHFHFPSIAHPTSLPRRTRVHLITFSTNSRFHSLVEPVPVYHLASRTPDARLLSSLRAAASASPPAVDSKHIARTVVHEVASSPTPSPHSFE